MEFFGERHTIQQRLDGSLYLIGRLRLGGHEDLLGLFSPRYQAYKGAFRTLEDAREPVVLAIADRDALDEELDGVAKTGGAKLRGRSTTAATESPYTDVVPNGMDAITLATLADTPAEYTGLVERAGKYLPDGDPVRVEFEQKLPPLVAKFVEKRDQVHAANRAQAMLQGDFDNVEEELDRCYEKVAGALIARVGKRAANRYFWRRRRSRKLAGK